MFLNRVIKKNQEDLLALDVDSDAKKKALAFLFSALSSFQRRRNWDRRNRRKRKKKKKRRKRRLLFGY